MIEENKDSLCCPDCGSIRVQCTAWIDANTDKVLQSGYDGPRSHFWCSSCEDQGDDGEKKHLTTINEFEKEMAS